MEEDIREIEDNIDMFMDTLYENYRQSAVKPFEKAIQNLIARYKELEEINKNLKKQVDIKIVECIDKKYIPKSKVKEKIEELENQKPLYFEKQVIQGRIDLLQELLED